MKRGLSFLRPSSVFLGGMAPTTKLKGFRLTGPSNPKECFFLPLRPEIEALQKVVSDVSQKLIMIRGPPAAGKTTLALQLVRQFSCANAAGSELCRGGCVLLNGKEIWHAKDGNEEVLSQLNAGTNNYFEKAKITNIRTAFTALAEADVTILVDNASGMFRFTNMSSEEKNMRANFSRVHTCFFKTDLSSQPRIIFLGSLSERTPELDKEFIWTGTFTVADAISELKHTALNNLEDQAVELLCEMSGYRRGVMGSLCSWILETNVLPTAGNQLITTIDIIRAARSDWPGFVRHALHWSRAVKVSGIPPPLPALIALAQGELCVSQFPAIDPRDVRKCAMRGFLKPVLQSSEGPFIPSSRLVEGKYTICHHFQADRYHEALNKAISGGRLVLSPLRPCKNIHDVLLAAIPSLRLPNLLVNPAVDINGGLYENDQGLPAEDLWTGELKRCFNQVRGMKPMSTGGISTTKGLRKIDVVWQSDDKQMFLIENVMAAVSAEVMQEHLMRFSTNDHPKVKKPAHQGRSHRGLVLIGKSLKSIETGLKTLTYHESVSSVSVMGIYPSPGYTSINYVVTEWNEEKKLCVANHLEVRVMGFPVAWLMEKWKQRGGWKLCQLWM